VSNEAIICALQGFERLRFDVCTGLFFHPMASNLSVNTCVGIALFVRESHRFRPKSRSFEVRQHEASSSKKTRVDQRSGCVRGVSDLRRSAHSPLPPPGTPSPVPLGTPGPGLARPRGQQVEVGQHEEARRAESSVLVGALSASAVDEGHHLLFCMLLPSRGLALGRRPRSLEIRMPTSRTS